MAETIRLDKKYTAYMRHTLNEYTENFKIKE